MEAKRWTLGVVLAGAVSLVGLVGANASPFSTYLLSDDLGDVVRGSAPTASEWEGDADDGSADGSADGASSDGGGKSNNGHGNNADGVDSSNPSQGKGGPNGEADASCDGTGDCVDDEISKSTDSSGATETTTETKTNNGKKK